jgi:hypothetical protein
VAAALVQHKLQMQRPAAAERPGGRERGLPLSRRAGGSAVVSGHVSGIGSGEGWALPQVAGLGPTPSKIVRVFEFTRLIRAPGRIRTRAHGSGDPCPAGL